MSFDLNSAYKDLLASGPKKTVTGGCTCGAIKYTLALPFFEDGSLRATRCNCSLCQKFGITSLSPESQEDFKLLQPASKAEISGDFTRAPSRYHKYFCAACGVHVFQEGSYEHEGRKQEFFLVNIGTVDQPQEGVDLEKVRVRYWDGLHWNWGGGMKETSWPNGLV